MKGANCKIMQLEVMLKIKKNIIVQQQRHSNSCSCRLMHTNVVCDVSISFLIQSLTINVGHAKGAKIRSAVFTFNVHMTLPRNEILVVICCCKCCFLSVPEKLLLISLIYPRTAGQLMRSSCIWGHICLGTHRHSWFSTAWLVPYSGVSRIL